MDVYKIAAACMILSRLEFTGHGDMSTGNLKNGAGEQLMEMFQYCGAADELYDRFCNPKIKVFAKLMKINILAYTSTNLALLHNK